MMASSSSVASSSSRRAALSPLLAPLSPYCDSSDLSSDDGDSLHTPVTEQHDHRLLPCDVYEDHRYARSDAYIDISPNPSPSLAIDTGKAQYGSPARPSSSALPEPSHDATIPQHASVRALDASRENTSFSSPAHSSRTLDPTASPFTPTRQTFRPSSPIFSTSPFPLPEPSPSRGQLPSLPSLTLSNIGYDNADDQPSLLASAHGLDEELTFAPSPDINADSVLCKGRLYSSRFHHEHVLNPFFVQHYHLEDELGAGGYGFVMTARQRAHGHEVAVKFIIKDKVPDHAWWEDDTYGRVPTEVMLLSLVNHENIVKCLDLFEDEVYFYLVQELHGTPWVSRKHKKAKRSSAPEKLAVPLPSETPTLSPSPSVSSSLGSAPHTPPQLASDDAAVQDAASSCGKLGDFPAEVRDSLEDDLLSLPPSAPPKFARRPSHDLFECIEQSKHKRLSEDEARYIFAQVVEAVHYLDSQGITHCDIKDENLVIDADLRVKLIDFGSAVVADPTRPRPYYTLFFGTTAYASSEILKKKPYQAPPAEIWTLGVLLSYLLTGHSPFPMESDAREGRVVIREPKSGKLSKSAIQLMTRCLEKDPILRADIEEVRDHPWLRGAFDGRGQD